MNTERLLYSIKRKLPVILIVALIAVGVLVYILLRGPTEEPVDNPTATPTPVIDNTIIDTNPTEISDVPQQPSVSISKADLKPDVEPIEHQYISDNMVCVELLILEDWENGDRYGTYYDKIAGTYHNYKIEKDEGQEPLLKETVQPVSFTGMPEAIHDLPATLEYSVQSDRQPLTVLEVDKFFAVTRFEDGYDWLAEKLTTGYEFISARIQHDFMDVYLKLNDKFYRAILTDGYIIFNEYIGSIKN